MKIKKYLNLLFSPIKIEIVCIAIQMKLFDSLQKASRLKEIQNILNFSNKNSKIFLDSLVVLKLLKYKDNYYKNSSLAKKYFVSSSEYYLGDMFLYRKEYFEFYQKNLFDLLQTETITDINLQDETQWATISQSYFFQEQKTILSELVVDIVKNLREYGKIKKILDVGCSAGVLSLELLKANKDFEAVLFDFEKVIKQSKKNIKKYKLEDRVCTLAGDIQKDELKDKYDLVLCSNILHLLEKKEEVLTKIYNSLNQDGILLIIQSNYMDYSTNSVDNHFYNLSSMVSEDKYIQNYPSIDMILNSGFKSVHSFVSDRFAAQNTKIYIVKR